MFSTRVCVCSTRVCVYRVLKEQWIRAKYERKEFMEAGKKLIYEDGK